MALGKVPIQVLLTAHLRADPRKTAVLAVLALVMIGLYARWVWGGDSPASAEAGLVPAVVSTEATPAPLAASRGLTARIELKQPVARDLRSDPFALDLQKFPLGHSEPKPVTAAPAPVGEDPVEAAARQLVLESTLYGADPVACINGIFLRRGQRINGFVLEKITPTRVVLGREGLKVELSLK